MARRTLRDLVTAYKKGGRWVMSTAYDFPMAHVTEAAGVDLILVGDSLGQVVLGYPDTLSVTLDDMVRHAGAVVRGAPDTFVVADLPFLTYHVSAEQALVNAGRLMTEARVQAVKLEGGARVADTVRRLVDAGIPVMGHLGFTPQSVYAFGGYTVQGRSEAAAETLYTDALALEAAGAFAVVLEMVPAPLAALITEATHIPTIGIGAGAATDGQVLVVHDMLGLYWGRAPRFTKKYAEIGQAMEAALRQYADEVRGGVFPAAEHTFSMEPAVLERLVKRHPPSPPPDAVD